MKFKITAIYPTGPKTYAAIGERNALMDNAYDDGALGVSILVLEKRP